ncbi:miraculin-like [Solanum dulcamara]|uniref:miraculin-like n=1 Tax=Solanum dulcamara TaxID=45834 RepID=UPI002486079D|nr:miraculin-like [Solanum dulcamara]XP_055826198.1 miraculin-like [Solanum dulcamara]
MFIINSLLSEAASASNPVLDTTGKIIRVGFDYMIVPVKKDLGGELGLDFIGTQVCPLGIGPRLNPNQTGLSINLFPVNSKKGVIRESIDLNVEFTETYTICPHNSNVWMLDHYNPQKEDQYMITNGGVKGNPGRDTIRNWFKIVKYGVGYKFVFCPSVCNYCEVICKNVGIFVQNNGQALLTLSNEPLEVVFKKV